MKIRILAISAIVVSTFSAVACSFGPDAYNGPPVCPGDAPPDTVMVPDGECWDGGGLPPDAGSAGASSAGSSGAGTAGASAGSSGANSAGTAGASAGSGG